MFEPLCEPVGAELERVGRLGAQDLAVELAQDGRVTRRKRRHDVGSSRLGVAAWTVRVIELEVLREALSTRALAESVECEGLEGEIGMRAPAWVGSHAKLERLGLQSERSLALRIARLVRSRRACV